MRPGVCNLRAVAARAEDGDNAAMHDRLIVGLSVAAAFAAALCGVGANLALMIVVCLALGALVLGLAVGRVVAFIFARIDKPHAESKGSS